MSVSKNETYERRLLANIRKDSSYIKARILQDEIFQNKNSSDVEKKSKTSSKKQNILLIAIVFTLISVVVSGYLLYRFVTEDINNLQESNENDEDDNIPVDDVHDFTSSLSFPGCGKVGAFDERNKSIAFPSLVNVTVNNEVKCFGVLISPDLILSKAECFYKNQQRIEENQIKITLGWNEISTLDESWYEVPLNGCFKNKTRDDVYLKRLLCLRINKSSSTTETDNDKIEHKFQVVIANISNKWHLVGFKKQIIYDIGKKLLIVERVDYYESWLSSLVFAQPFAV